VGRRPRERAAVRLITFSAAEAAAPFHPTPPDQTAIMLHRPGRIGLKPLLDEPIGAVEDAGDG